VKKKQTILIISGKQRSQEIRHRKAIDTVSMSFYLAKEGYMYVLPNILLFVCFSLSNFTHKKLLIENSWNFLPHMYLWTRKSTLNSGSHPDPDPDPGIFLRNFFLMFPAFCVTWAWQHAIKLIKLAAMHTTWWWWWWWRRRRRCRNVFKMSCLVKVIVAYCWKKMTFCTS